MKLSISVFYLATAVAFALAIDLPERSGDAPLEWWQEEIVYQVYPRSHKDTNGDGTGDLKGIQEKLDYFVELGVGSVWISPFYKSPMADFGYDISDFRAIDPIFGTMEDFESLKKAMDEKGIKLIMDFVPNHSSDQHEWFNKSISRDGKYADYYVWRNSSSNDPNNPAPPNNWVSLFGGSAWTWNDQRQQYYLHQFAKEQPDLNYENEAVVQEILAAAYFWLNNTGIDGFRVDAVPHLFEDQDFGDEPKNPDAPPDAKCEPELFDHICLLHTKTYNLPKVFDFLASFRKVVDNSAQAQNKSKVMMVESSVPTLDLLMEYYEHEGKPIAHYPFNFEFLNRFKSGVNAAELQTLVDEWYNKMPKGKTANWLLGNHDVSRVASRFSPELVDALNMLNLLLPGSAVTYYGEEIGMVNRNMTFLETRDPAGCNAGPDRYHLFSRDPSRTPMQWDNTTNAGFSTAAETWLPVNENYLELNVMKQNADAESHLKVYKELVKLRKSDLWRFGSLSSRADGNLFTFTRQLNKEGLAYLANFGTQEVTVNLPSIFPRVPINATIAVKSVGFKVDDFERTDDIKIGAKQAIVLKYEPLEYVPTTTEDGNPGKTPTAAPTDPPTNPPTNPPGDDNSGAPRNLSGLFFVFLAIFTYFQF